VTRKELALLVGSTLATLLIAVGLLRWLAPGLLGGPRDLELVKSSREVPPFYEGVFRLEHAQTTDFLLKDPRTLNRARPFHDEELITSMGPHDVLGFRNRGVPAVADVVTLGDSQTYGVNVLLEDSWPGAMQRALGHASVYTMAVGSWGAVQYADMFVNATAFRPRVIVVAFYSGNDPLDSFGLAYGSELWRELRADPGVTAADAPAVPFPPPESEWWRPDLGGAPMGFMPKTRLYSNEDAPAANAGWGVMRKAAGVMASVAARGGFRVVMTVVPTKELAYARRILAEKVEAPAEYGRLIDAEARRIADFCAHAATLPATTCVDLVEPLQRAALTDPELYPRNINGHPLASGYRVIGEALAAAVAAWVPRVPDGWVATYQQGTDEVEAVFLVRDGVAWKFGSKALVTASGWTEPRVLRVTPRDLAGLPKRMVLAPDPDRLGPR
jgi:hypothetical protein